jgi:predicted nucleotidyltransferase
MEITGPLQLPSLGQIRAAAQRIGEDLGCRLIVLFGSAARGDTRPADLDIGILREAPLDIVALTNHMTQKLGTQSVDLCDLRRADPLLLALAARDGIPLYEQPPGEFARFASLAARRYFDTRKFREMERREIQDLLKGMPQRS